MSPATNAPYDEGIDAALEGETADACPYTLGTDEYEEWWLGYTSLRVDDLLLPYDWDDDPVEVEDEVYEERDAWEVPW